MSAAYERHGDDAAAMQLDDMVEAAGIARSTFYVYFPDRLDFYAALVARVTGELTAACAYWTTVGNDITAPHLREATERLVDAFRSHRVTADVLLDVVSRNTQLQRTYRAAIGGFAAALADDLRARQRSGSITVPLDPDPTATWMVWLLERTLTDLVGPADVDDTDRYVSSLALMVGNVLGVEPPPTPGATP